jgi:hypothetical protein
VIAAVIVSNWVAHWLHPDGLYEAELHSGAAPCYYLRQEPPHALRGQTAEGVMASPVVGLAPVEHARVVLQALRRTTHNGFPVLAPGKAQRGRPVDPGGLGRASGRLQGLVLRSQVGLRGDALLPLLVVSWVSMGARERAGRCCTHHQLLTLPLPRAPPPHPPPPPTPTPPPFSSPHPTQHQQLLVLLRHGAFCDERGRYLCSSARHNAAAFEQALALEMQAAAQAGGSGYRTTPSRRGLLGQLGPATSLGIAGEGFPTLDASRGAAALPERDVLDSAAAAAEGELEGGRVAYLNLAPFMNLAPTTGAPRRACCAAHAALRLAACYSPQMFDARLPIVRQLPGKGF